MRTGANQRRHCCKACKAKNYGPISAASSKRARILSESNLACQAKKGHITGWSEDIVMDLLVRRNTGPRNAGAGLWNAR
jgi:hypothetical protein